MAEILSGKLVAGQVKIGLKQEVAALTAQGIPVGLDVILVGADLASSVYVRNKHQDCLDIGIASNVHRLPSETTEDELVSLIKKLNADPAVSGILVQLPIPCHLDEKKVIETISPAKDVDAFCEVNVGKVMIGNYIFAPCTPSGVIELLNHYSVPIAGKHCVIVGRSNIVGKPMAMLLLQENATVTICHSRTADLAAITRQADILVAAVGRVNMITADMIKEGAVVVDVGINRAADGSLCGDVDYIPVAEKASLITPVPGGVGPMTRAVLLKNTVIAAKGLAAAAKK